MSNTNSRYTTYHLLSITIQFVKIGASDWPCAMAEMGGTFRLNLLWTKPCTRESFCFHLNILWHNELVCSSDSLSLSLTHSTHSFDFHETESHGDRKRVEQCRKKRNKIMTYLNVDCVCDAKRCNRLIELSWVIT